MSKNDLYLTQELKIKKIKQDENFKEEKIHDYFEKNLKEIIGADIIQREYEVTGGRMDTLAIDEDDRPVIIEYKRKKVGHALIQSLFYRDWLYKNKRQFYLEVKDKFGEERAGNINWQIRVILVAQEYEPWTLAAAQWVRYLEMYRFNFYDDFKMCHLEFLNESIPTRISDSYKNLEKDKFINSKQILDKATGLIADYENAEVVITKGGKENYTNLYRYNKISEEMKEIFHSIISFMEEIDESITLYKNKDYWAFKKSKKFAEVIFGSNHITIQLLLPKDRTELSTYSWKKEVGHWGSFHSHFKITNINEFNEIKVYINESFDTANK